MEKARELPIKLYQRPGIIISYQRPGMIPVTIDLRSDRIKKGRNFRIPALFVLVGAIRFERTTSRTPSGFSGHGQALENTRKPAPVLDLSPIRALMQFALLQAILTIFYYIFTTVD